MENKNPEIKSYDVVLTFKGTDTKAIGYLKTDNLDRATDDLRFELFKKSGLEMETSMATERWFGRIAAINAISVKCPHCERVSLIDNVTKMVPDDFGHAPLICVHCKQQFFLGQP